MRIDSSALLAFPRKPHARASPDFCHGLLQKGGVVRSGKWLIRVNLFAIGFCAGLFCYEPNLSATSPHFPVAMVNNLRRADSSDRFRIEFRVATKDSGPSAHEPVWQCACESSRVVPIRRPLRLVTDVGENASREGPYNRGPICNHGF